MDFERHSEMETREELIRENNDLPDNLELTEEFKEAFDLLERSKESVFITGKAGTGKSTLLKYFKAKTKKNIVVLAPTGLAAINVRGKTLHSFFKFPWGVLKKEDMSKWGSIRDVLLHADAIIIDEISMVRADLMDAIDYSLRKNMGSDLPFGGLQMIFFGDLLQLPPIATKREVNQYFENRYGGFYFFNADIIKEINLKYIELTKVYRQKDKQFIELLDKIRQGELQEHDLAIINRRVNKLAGEGRKDHFITLTTTNAIANGINERRLAQLDEKEYEYQAVIMGELDPKFYPAPYTLKLKKGAQVMMVKNDKYKRWVNGTIGVVEDLSWDCIKVSIGDVVYEVTEETWQDIDYVFDSISGRLEEKVIGTFEQYPVKLAWAITIHKAQGHGFANIIIDLGNGAFAPGQTYVALSRCTTLEGIFLKKPIRYRDIIFDKKVYRFMKKFARTSNDW